MLRKIRIGISVVLFALITFYFLDFANILPNSFHRLAHIQFVPAVLSLSIGILIVLIALTLLFGRIYCSTICPMGIWQDVIARISKSVGKKKKRYRYSPAKNMLRWTVLWSDCNCLRMLASQWYWDCWTRIAHTDAL